MTIIVQVVTKVLMDRPCHQKITTGTIGAIGSIFTHGRNWLPLVIRSVIQGQPNGDHYIAMVVNAFPGAYV